MTQRDIGEVQLAKAAICTGIAILSRELNVAPQEIRHIYLAGAFGAHINPASAKTLGLIPSVSLDSIRTVGNAAIIGAKMVLASGAQRQLGEKIANKIKYVELAFHPNFHTLFIESLKFPYNVIKPDEGVADHDH